MEDHLATKQHDSRQKHRRISQEAHSAVAGRRTRGAARIGSHVVSGSSTGKCHGRNRECICYRVSDGAGGRHRIQFHELALSRM